MSIPFVVGGLYYRKDVRRHLGLEPEKIGGVWSSGYVRHEHNWFIFANIQSEGTTGHNYNNRWVSGQLHWSGNTHSHLKQPSIQSLLSSKVFIFTREDNKQPFVFRGNGIHVEVRNTVPVVVVWKIETPTSR